MARELWETVSTLVEALAMTPGESLGLKVRTVTVDLPSEWVVVQTKVGFQLLVDALHYRWDPGLRPEPGRLRLELAQMREEEEFWMKQFGRAGLTEAPAGTVPGSPGGSGG